MPSKFIAFTTLLMACAGAMPAYAQVAGEVVSTGGQQGSVLVTREGQTYPILRGDPIFEGDIITTRRGSSATLSTNDCRVQLSASEQVTVSGAMCGPDAIVPAAMAVQLPEQAGLITPARLLIGGATVGVVAALLLSDDDDDEPVSP
ncbi:MAG: hypothetical protein AAGJ84_11310 [Pseudomonadota bacterium]